MPLDHLTRHLARIPEGHNHSVLKGKNIHLRILRKADLEKYSDFMSDIESRGPHFPLDLESESALLDRFSKTGLWTPERGVMVIVDNKTKRLLGQVVFFKPEPYYDAFELGYLIFDPKDRGKGITSEALDLFTKYLFDAKNICRLQLQLEGANIGSRRVAEKCGYNHEGTARSALYMRGKPVDLEVYAMTRDDFDRRTATKPKSTKKK